MRIQSQLLLIFVCLNAGMTLVDGLGSAGVIPGYALSHGLTNSTSSSTDPNSAAVQYGNATDIAGQWTAKAPTVIGVIGDVVGALPWYFKMIADVITGFPFLIAQLGSAFPLDNTSANVVLLFVTALSVIWGWLMVSFIVELISGRFLNEG